MDEWKKRSGRPPKERPIPQKNPRKKTSKVPTLDRLVENLQVWTHRPENAGLVGSEYSLTLKGMSHDSHES